MGGWSARRGREKRKRERKSGSWKLWSKIDEKKKRDEYRKGNSCV
jgi:hypothetical protein